MAKEVAIGEMRTRITVQRLASVEENENGFQVKTWETLFGGRKAWCKWVNPHGREVDELLRIDLAQQATLTMRYTPLVDEGCRIFKDYAPTGGPEDDTRAWEVVSVDNVEERRKTLEIRVKRTVKA